MKYQVIRNPEVSETVDLLGWEYDPPTEIDIPGVYPAHMHQIMEQLGFPLEDLGISRFEKQDLVYPVKLSSTATAIMTQDRVYGGTTPLVTLSSAGPLFEVVAEYEVEV